MPNTPKVLGWFTDYAGYTERRKLNTFGGIGYYRMHKPLQQLASFKTDIVGADITKFGETSQAQFEQIFNEYDAFWAVHYFNEELQLTQSFNAARYGKLNIMDLDDNYLDLPESNPVYDKFFKTNETGNHHSSRNKATLTAALSLADVLTVSTYPLKERMQAHFDTAYAGQPTPKIYVIPNMNDLADFNFEPAPKHKDRVVIGYQGSTSHMEDLQMVLPSIQNIMHRNPHVYLEILGAIDKKDLDQYFGNWDHKLLNRIGMWPSTRIFNEYPKWLAAQKWDIGIAPLVDSPFTRCKSHIKWMEYAAYGVPCVASRVYPYAMPIGERDTIIDGETGFLCRPGEWENVLQRLVDSEQLRVKIGKQAYEAVKRDWQYKDSEINGTFEEIFCNVKPKKLDIGTL